MTHHPAFSTRVRNQEADKAMGHSVVNPSATPGNAAGLSAAKTKGLLHDSAFMAERGCLGASKLAGHPGQAHSR
jgi:hypothetical protein